MRAIRLLVFIYQTSLFNHTEWHSRDHDHNVINDRLQQLRCDAVLRIPVGRLVSASARSSPAVVLRPWPSSLCREWPTSFRQEIAFATSFLFLLRHKLLISTVSQICASGGSMGIAGEFGRACGRWRCAWWRWRSVRGVQGAAGEPRGRKPWGSSGASRCRVEAGPEGGIAVRSRTKNP
jgi:hypothetical protein